MGGPGDIESLTETAGASGKLRCRGVRGQFAIGGHGFLTENRFERTDQDAAGHAYRLTCDIDAVVHAVNEVDVGMAGRSEHDAISFGDAAEAVGCWIGCFSDMRAEVSFDFDDAAGEPAGRGAAGEQFAEKPRRDDLGRFREKPPWYLLPGSG